MVRRLGLAMFFVRLKGIVLQPHSASKNHLRIPRFITNPPVTLKDPLNLNRSDPGDYVSLQARS